MAKAHALMRSVAASIAKQVTNLMQGPNIEWNFGTAPNLCSRHSTPLSLKVHVHGMSRMSLTCSLVSRPPWESGVTSLF